MKALLVLVALTSLAHADFDLGKPSFGLEPKVSGWKATWDEAGKRITFSSKAASMFAVAVTNPPARAEDSNAPRFLSVIGLDKISGVSHAKSGTPGWSAVLDGTMKRVYVAVHAWDTGDIACVGELDKNLTEKEAAKVCASLAPKTKTVTGCPTCPKSSCKDGAACFAEGRAAFTGNKLPEAFAAWTRGCTLKHGLSCSGVGDLYAGAKRISLSYEQGVAFWTKACKLDNANGCNNLGWCYERGLGVAESQPLAEAQYVKACKLMPGSAACENADIMKSRREGREK